MQLLALSALLLLLSSSCGADDTVLLSASTVLDNPLGYTAIIALPTSCAYSGKNATVRITGPITTNPWFIVPQCRLKRDLLVVSDPNNGNAETVNVGYQITGLTPGNTYSAQYVIDGVSFNPVSFATKNVTNLSSSVFARSGGMVVITVLLSIAMCLLLIGLIAALVLGGRGTK